MNLPEVAAVERVAVIGTGVIGSSWAAHFLRQGRQVAAYDPGPNAEAKSRQFIADKWPMMEKLGLKAGASLDNFIWVESIAMAVAEAQFIQESAPEREALKVALLAEIDRHAPLDCIIASSTSGYPMTLLQRACAHPERTVVGHPFNPPYLVPLVEVAGGEQTAAEAVAWTADFYNHIQKYALKMDRELPGFVANRLQEALWREALHMINEGMATVDEIDASIVYGPGLRWALMGPMLTFHLAGGEGGMAHMLDHFDPNTFETWTFLKAPQMTPELKGRIVAGCEAEANGRTIPELERQRDERIIAILQALAPFGRM